VHGYLKGTTTVHRVYPYTLGYMRAPWQLWCSFETHNYQV